MKDKVKKKIDGSPLLSKWWWRIKTLSFPGFERIPIFDVIKMLRQEIKNDKLSLRAAAISFYFILALFPTSIFIFTLIAYIPIMGFNETLLTYIESIMPDGTFEIIDHTVHDIINKRRAGWLSITFFLAFYFSINAVTNIIKAFEKVNPTFKKRNWIQNFIAASKISLLINFQLLFVIALIILSQDQLNNLMSTFGIWKSKSALFLQFFRIILTLITFFNTVALIYYFAPAVKKKYKYFSVGATFATIALLVVSYLFSFYVKYMLNQLHAVYGPLSAMIFIMIWIYINSFVILFGFELNNSIALHKHKEE